MIKEKLKNFLKKKHLNVSLKSARHPMVEKYLKNAKLLGFTIEQLEEFLNDPEASLKLKHLFIVDSPKRVSFDLVAKNFFIEVIFEDIYQLEKIPFKNNEKIKIIDVGANCGIFGVMARARFPHSTIHCYEPNEKLKKYYDLQSFAAYLKYFDEAVGLNDGFCGSDERQNIMFDCEAVKMMDFQKEGKIKVTALKNALKRIGGYVDLLKLDCEGSEWNILKDKDSLKKVKYLTMEYHRMCHDNSFDVFDFSIDIQKKACDILRENNFEILHAKNTSHTAGVLSAKNNNFCLD
ncbi:MAG: hypothetical protein K940chlam1_01125 [Candidatus Anoxychlamydiales bacterium]|nr:hypothetical protein [Candidatus Anoxychlamydiales bacterium]NGX35218.1 hypothetical protein [Candidatus Anoxychlamydiales bacterium]